MKTSLTSAMKTTVVPSRFSQLRRLRYHHLSDLVVAALTVFICAAAPGIAIPLPPGAGSSVATSSSAGGARRPGPIGMFTKQGGGEQVSQGPRRPMQIASAQPPGCTGVIAEQRMRHR